MTLPVRTTPEADLQILEIDGWGRRNRDASPNLFLDELTAAFDTVGDAPYLGRLYQQSPIPGTRRVLLKGTRYHVYYVPSANETRVLAVWHARGGGRPTASRAIDSVAGVPGAADLVAVWFYWGRRPLRFKRP